MLLDSLGCRRRRDDRDCAGGAYWFWKNDREQYRNPSRSERQPSRDPDRKTRNDPERNQTISGGKCDRPDNEIDPRESSKGTAQGGSDHDHDAIDNPAHAPDELIVLDRADGVRKKV